MDATTFNEERKKESERKRRMPTGLRRNRLITLPKGILTMFIRDQLSTRSIGRMREEGPEKGEGRGRERERGRMHYRGIPSSSLR